MDPNQMGVAGQPVPNQPTMSNMPEFGVQPQAQAPVQSQPVAAQPVAQPATQPAPEQPVMAETLTMEQQMEVAMQEPVMETPAPAPMPVEAPKKKGKGMMICLIAALIVAAGGIGFGIYMMISGQQTEDNYKKQISSLQTTINQMQSSGSEVIVVTTPDEEEVELSAPSNVDPADYVYVGEWGMKIEIPEGLKLTNIRIVSGDNSSDVEINGFLCADTCDVASESALATLSSGAIGRLAKGTTPTLPATLLFSDDTYSYYYIGTLDEIVEGDENSDLKAASRQAIKDMLTNPENYSAI